MGNTEGGWDGELSPEATTDFVAVALDEHGGELWRWQVTLAARTLPGIRSHRLCRRGPIVTFLWASIFLMPYFSGLLMFSGHAQVIAFPSSSFTFCSLLLPSSATIVALVTFCTPSLSFRVN